MEINNMQFLTFTTPTPPDYYKAGYPFDTVLWVIEPSSKSDLEKIFGSLTDEQYHAHILERNLQVNSRMVGINAQDVRLLEIPNSREFREAWCDVTPESAIDIDLVKAKELKLSQMRIQRQKKFEDLGFPQKLNPEVENAIVSPEIKAKLQALRDVTEPLKALKAEGYNDEAVLEQIRQLGKLNG